ncbi:MAG: D-alanyl-D-alanine carboxypeptidase/D-alanyl-D-alanine-endopeptidase [Myxococcota bacterium]
MGRWFLPLTATAVLSVAAPFLARAQDGEAEPTQAEDPAEPAPEPVVAAAPAGVDVSAALASVGNSWLFTRADSGLRVVDLSTRQKVFGRNDDRMLQPASTMKVITSAAALRNLGPAYRFTTDVFYDGELQPNGVLQGNLYVKGHGDPTFTVEDLWKLVEDIELAGVDKVVGSVVFDDSFHESGTVLPGWDKPEDIEKGTSYFATLSALSLNSNTVVLVVRPGAEVGSTARVTLETPTLGYVQLDNQVKTGGARSRKSIEVTREVLPDGTKFSLTGNVPVDEIERTTLRRTVADPTAHFVAAFHAKMRERDIDVTGRYQRGTTPPAAKLLLSADSPPLAQIVAEMNKSSLNFVAEQVLRTVGAEVMGEGSTRSGLAVVGQYLGSIGVPPGDIVLVNGSGLSRDIRMKASVLTAVLEDMAVDPQVGSEFAASLAISGTDGTLWSRLREDPGRLRGKTGTLDGVHCLAGYVDSQGGRRYAFAFLVNNYGSRLQSVRDVHDTFARQLFRLGGGPG